MTDPIDDLQKAVIEMSFRVMALNLLVSSVLKRAPELRAIVRELPDPDPQGAEFLGRRFGGSAEAGKVLVQKYVETWQQIVAQINDGK